MPDQIAAGTELGEYRIAGLVGQGGMAVVYLAEPLAGGERVALKVLSPDLGNTEESRRRFLRESSYAGSLDHPNVMPVLAAGEFDGSLFMVMPYVKGTDLKKYLAVEGALPPGRAVALVTQVAAALDAVHEVGLLHRDVKPANVIIASGEGPEAAGHCYLTDFGLSKNPTRDSGALTAVGDFVGTYYYTAPEQILGQDVDARSDVYSLGCLLYECLTGEPPFRYPGAEVVLHAHIEEPPPSASAARPGVPPELDEVITTAMAKDPARRYGSCMEMMDAAGAAAGDGAGVPDAIHLRVTAGNAAGTVISVTDELLIGRQAKGEGSLEGDIEISRQHARIAAREDGRYAVEDLGSTNGTFVNGHRIDRPTALERGDRVEFGGTTLVVQASAPPPIGDSAASEAPATADTPPSTPIPETDAADAEAEPAAPRITLHIEMEGAPQARLTLEGGQWRLDPSPEP